MELQQWIDGAFEETDTDYTIAGMNILYKEETEYLKKGVRLLCDKLHPSSVLEFGFGKGWTATEFQEQGIKRHVILEPNKANYQMALDWKNNYSTDIDFRLSNKWRLELSDDIAQMNLIFPNTSGNFLLYIRYDGDWSIGDWKVWESDLTAATTGDVAWAGGTQPDHTDSGKDIYSFYWDAENQQAYGVASLAFALP